MRNPHKLSAPHTIDPAYSATKRQPDGSGLSLYGARGTGASWFFFPGDLSAFLMAGARERAFRDVHNIFHPGLFRPCHACVQFETVLSAPPKKSFSFYHSGTARMEIDGHLAGTWPASPNPAERSIDLRPFLKPAGGRLRIILCTHGEPALLRAEGNWRCSANSQQWEEPETAPFTGPFRFPHQENLPSLPVAARKRNGILYDFETELIGKVRVKNSTTRRIFQPGESIPEACDGSEAAKEQPLLATGSASSGEAAFRYLRLEAGSAPEPKNVVCDLAVHPAAYRGAFACSDELATRIWMHAAYTLRLCMRDVTLDGLKRDRLPWVGDLFLSLEANAFSFAEHSLFRRTLLSFYHDHPDSSDFSGIFDYTLLWIAAAGRYVFYSGDEAGARILWPRVRRVLDALKPRLSKEGFLQSEGTSWIFLDWCKLPKSGLLLAIQCLYLFALDGAAGLAAMASSPEDASALRRQANALRRLAGKRFWNPKEQRFADAWRSKLSPHGSHHAQALAALGGIAPAARLRQALLACRKDSASPEMATPYMRFFECTALARTGETEAMLGEISSYWGGMLEAGATTFWEAYDPAHTRSEHLAFYGRPFGKSLCHAWSAGPMVLYSSEIFGLRPLGPGWKQFAFSPSLGSLAWASVVIPTPRGDIRAEAEGTSARLVIPPHCSLPSWKLPPASKKREVIFKRQKARWSPSF